MSELPFASVVVAAYNAEKTIRRCLEALLALDYPDYEIIVVDNNSRDHTRAIVEEVAADAQRPIVVLDEPRPGWPAARNRAWHFSKAPLVANIDADCFAEKDWLRRLVEALLPDQSAGCAVGRTKVEPGKTLAQRYYAACDPFNIEKYVYKTERAAGRSCPWGGGNNCFRREVFEAIGGYDDATYISGADREYHRRMEEQTPYRTIYVPGALIWHTPRGSLGEFFRVSAKTARGTLRATAHDPSLRRFVRFYILRRLGRLLVQWAALCYRGVRFLVGRETSDRVAEPFFHSACLLGAIWGYGFERLARGLGLSTGKAPATERNDHG